MTNRYLAQASYATATGRMAGMTWDVYAKTLDEAQEKAWRRIWDGKRTKIDLVITPVKRDAWP